MKEKEPRMLPPIVWTFFVVLATFVLLLAFFTIGYFHHASIQDFISAVVEDFVVLLKVAFAGAVLYGVVRFWHTISLQKQSRRVAKGRADKLQLQNEVLRQRALAAQQLPTVMEQAMRLGLNITYEGLAVSSWRSNVHTIQSPQVVDADPVRQLAAPPRRLTLDEICRHVERNSYRVLIGSSLTKNLTAVSISILKRHLKVIGATQKGKSSFVGSFITIVMQTHDPSHIQFALLDKEHQTSRLFADLPHLLKVVVDDRTVPVHAKNPEEVVEHLGYLLQVLEARNAMSRTVLAQQPIIIVYLEEFLRLKRELKAACKTAQDKDEALRLYTQFTFAVGQLAGLGLKLRMQLLLVAQMDYADDDPEMQEAMVNISCGLSFCVRPTAARAAGFYNNALLTRNAQENMAGQAVCETPDCNDLILAPDFDLEARLIAREEAEIQDEEEEGEAVRHNGLYLVRTGETAHPPVVDEHELQQVVGAWNKGYCSIGKVMQATGLGQNRSRVLIAQAKNKGLIVDK
jgi:hypothetical protein